MRPERLTPTQRRAVDGLMRRGVLSTEQASAVLAELDGGRESRPRFGGVVAEILGYVGGALILGGASLLLGMSWDELSHAARVSLLAVATVVLALAGSAVGGLSPGRIAAVPARRGRVVAVLFALASVTASMTVGSALDVVETVAATLVGLVTALAGYLVVPSVPGLLASGAFSVAVVLAGAQEWFDTSTTSVTVGLIVVGLVWAVLAGTGVLRYRDVGLGGAAVALAGAQWPVVSDSPGWGYAATAAVAVVCFLAYLRLRASVVLVVGVVGMTLVVPEAVWNWTGGALGGPLIVLIVGVVLLVAGGFGLYLRRETRNSS